jgi:YggT family protein
MANLIYRSLNIILNIIELMIFVRVIVSWLPISRDNQLIRTLYQLTEPILAPIRNIILKSAFGANMMFDFSPIIAWLIIRVIRMIIL